MKPINLIATTALGGACTAAVFGNLEAIWLLNTTGAPELVSLVYSVILYGLIGGGIAFGAGIGLVLLFKLVSSLEKFSSFAFGIGGSAALIPMGAFVLRYQMNKVVYAEQGVPMPTMLGILVALLAVSALLLALCKWKNITAKTGALVWAELISIHGCDFGNLARWWQSCSKGTRQRDDRCTQRQTERLDDDDRHPCAQTMWVHTTKSTSKRRTWMHWQRTVYSLRNASLKHRGLVPAVYRFSQVASPQVTPRKPRQHGFQMKPSCSVKSSKKMVSLPVHWQTTST